MKEIVQLKCAISGYFISCFENFRSSQDILEVNHRPSAFRFQIRSLSFICWSFSTVKIRVNGIFSKPRCIEFMESSSACGRISENKSTISSVNSSTKQVRSSVSGTHDFLCWGSVGLLRFPPLFVPPCVYPFGTIQDSCSPSTLSHQ